MRHAIIDSGVVVNVTVADEEFGVSQGWVQIPDGFGIGALYDGEIFSHPVVEPEPDPIPTVVSMRQARLALHAHGWLPLIDGAIDDLTEPQKTQARIEWEYAQTVNRDSPIVVMLSAELGMTEEQLDLLFTAAAAL